MASNVSELDTAKSNIIELFTHIGKIYNSSHNCPADVFWNCFRDSYNANPNGIDGKIRILSIIGENFIYKDMIDELEGSPNSINAARKFSRINGPGCVALKKPNITCLKMPEVKEKQFELFFADKKNINMSSYKVDAKTQLPVLYLKDQKNAL
ncbi:hypothetical protein RhiirC2_785079 [Rhizophagus irregularis]|uniref:Uncharacterized protein n=1 Tax=Rhizophagus irregularis TaxID=588596 RepID=A0A2N1MX15_9GLOM|nr:hypothetical protein RhiirC2_785079 [Rhizophagus irregularis]